jgi:hypothetical protein
MTQLAPKVNSSFEYVSRFYTFWRESVKEIDLQILFSGISPCAGGRSGFRLSPGWRDLAGRLL